MPGDLLTTVEELVAAGAHRTLEWVAVHRELEVSTAADFLSRRFGDRLQPENAGVLPVLVGRVQDAIRAGQLTNPLESPLEAEIPTLPGYPKGYSYTLIGYISDPLRPENEGQRVSFPIRINSPTLLTRDDLQRMADEALQEMAQSPDNRVTITINSPPGIVQAAGRISREHTGTVETNKIDVLSVYRGA